MRGFVEASEELESRLGREATPAEVTEFIIEKAAYFADKLKDEWKERDHPQGTDK
jgi:hypothetical protein